MTIEKKYLELILKVLKDTSLGLSDSRIRDAFIRKISVEFNQFDADRGVILKKFCDVDENGNPKTEILSNGRIQYHFSPEFQEDLGKEMSVLFDEIASIDITAEESEKITSFIETTSYKPEVGEVEDIDAILEKIV